MARLQSARVFVYQRLTAAVSEIMEHLEATFSQYEKEMESRHMTLLDSVCKAKERPLTAVQAVIKEEQQEWRLSLHQEDPEHPGGLHIKEEQQDLCSIQEVWSQLQGPQEEQIPDFPITAVLVTSEGDGEKAQLSQLHQRLCEEDREAEAPATCTAQHLGAGADGEEPCKASAAAFSGSDEIDASVIPVMVNGDMAKYVSKHGDRRPFGAFCRQAIASLDTKSRKDSIFTRLRQRPVSGELAVPAKNKPWIGNTSAKKRKRRVELGWMDFNEKERRYKQVKAVSGGGTRHLTIGKEKTVEEIKDIAEKLFFPNGFSKKKNKLSKYSTEIQSPQIQVNSCSTVEHLYEKSKVKLLRLYLCTKIRQVQLSSEEKEVPLSSTPVLHRRGSEPHSLNKVPGMDDMAHQEIDFEITYNLGK